MLYLAAQAGCSQEPFGKEVVMTVWHEEDRFWERIPMFGELQWQAAPEEVVSGDWAWMKNRWIVVDRDGQRVEYSVGHRIYDGAGLKSVLLEAGFESVELYGGVGGEPYDTDAQRLVALARKGDD